MARPQQRRQRRAFACAVATALSGLIGCAAGPDRPAAESRDTTGHEIGREHARVAPMLVRDFGVFLQVSFDGSDPVLMRYDTGSPTTVVDAGHARNVGLAGGERRARIGNVEIGRRTVTLVDWIEAEITYPGLPGPIKGVVGNDFFSGFAVGLHHHEQELWLMEDGAPIARPEGTEREGRSTAFDDSSGYLVVPCAFAPRSGERVCLFDTGAVNSLAFADHWQSVARPSGHSVPMITFDNQGNTVVGHYRRADTIVTGDIALADNVVVTVDAFALLSSVAAAIGEPVVGLIGLSGTFGYYTVIDYPRGTITVFPYRDREPLFPSPFVGYGFTVASDGRGGLQVTAVVPASDAAAAGIMTGDRIVAVDGRPLAEAGLEFSIAALIADAPGTRRVFEIDRGGSALRLEVRAEDLLPRSAGP